MNSTNSIRGRTLDCYSSSSVAAVAKRTLSRLVSPRSKSKEKVSKNLKEKRDSGTESTTQTKKKDGYI